MKRLFKKTLYQTTDSKKWFTMYEPTIKKKEAVSISDKSFRKYRVPSNLDMGFAIPKKWRKK